VGGHYYGTTNNLVYGIERLSWKAGEYQGLDVAVSVKNRRVGKLKRMLERLEKITRYDELITERGLSADDDATDAAAGHGSGLLPSGDVPADDDIEEEEEERDGTDDEDAAEEEDEEDEDPFAKLSLKQLRTNRKRLVTNRDKDTKLENEGKAYWTVEDDAVALAARLQKQYPRGWARVRVYRVMEGDIPTVYATDTVLNVDLEEWSATVTTEDCTLLSISPNGDDMMFQCTAKVIDYANVLPPEGKLTSASLDGLAVVAFTLPQSSWRRGGDFLQTSRNGGLTVFLGGYDDAYESKDNRVGLYMKELSLSAEFQAFSEAISTIAVHPKGVNRYELFAQIRKDMEKMRSGKWKMRYAKTGKDEVIWAMFALWCADSVALCELFGHGGSSSAANCPVCTTSIDMRTTDCKKMLCSNQTKTRGMRAQINQQILDEVGDNPHPSNPTFERVRKRYGSRDPTQPAQALGPGALDLTRMAYWEPSHLFKANMLPLMMEHSLKSLDPLQLEAFWARMVAFVADTGLDGVKDFIKVRRGTKKASKRKFTTGLGMEQMHNVYIAFMQCALGLVEESLYNHAVDLWRLYVGALYPEDDNINAVELKGLARYVRRIVTAGMVIAPEVWDRFSGHGVLEFVIRALPDLSGLARLLDGSMYERHHTIGGGKRLNNTKVVGKGNEAMRLWNVLQTLQYAQNGGCWGPNMEYGLHPDVLHRLDYRPGREHMPHPWLVELSPMNETRLGEPASVHDGYVESGYWRPKGRYDTKAAARQMDDRIKQSLNMFFRIRQDDAKLDVVSAGCMIRYPQSVELRDPDNFQQEVRLRPGDDIEGVYKYDLGVGKCYRRINAMVEVGMPVAWGGKKILLVCPTDFKVVGWDGDEPHRYQRGLPLIKLEREYKDGHVGRACPMGEVDRQVLIAHRCLLHAVGTPLLHWYQVAPPDRPKFCIMYDECSACGVVCPEAARLEREGAEFRRVQRGGQPLQKRARVDLVAGDGKECTAKKTKKWRCGNRRIYHAFDKKVAFRRSKRNVKTYPPPLRPISMVSGDGGANRGDKPVNVPIYTDDEDDDDVAAAHDDGDNDGDDEVADMDADADDGDAVVDDDGDGGFDYMGSIDDDLLDFL
jgi:hypothetical protein